MKKLIYIILIFLSYEINAQSTDTLLLQDAINKTLQNNYGIITIQKNTEISKLNNTWGTAGALPTINFIGSTSETWNFNDNDDFTNTQINGTVDLNWTIFRGFGIQIQKKQLDELQALSEGNAAIVIENSVINAISSYYNVLLQQEKTNIAKQNMQLSDDRYKQEKYKKEIGTSVTYNLLQAQNSYLQDKSNYLSEISSFKNSIRQLNFLMGETNDNNYIFATDFKADTTNFSKDTLLLKMISNNNTLKNQYINLEISRLDVKSAKSAYYPVLSAGASSGYNNTNSDFEENDLLDSNTDSYNSKINLSVSYNIYNGGTRKRALEAAKIKLRISEIEQQEIVHELTNMLAQEFELYSLRKQLLVLAEENLKAAKLNLDLSTEKYKSGSINSFNFRDVQQLYNNTALNYEYAKFNIIQSYYALLQLTGGIIEE